MRNSRLALPRNLLVIMAALILAGLACQAAELSTEANEAP